LLVLAIEATRGVTWFTLFALIVLPGALRELRLAAVTAGRSDLGLAVAFVVALGALIVAASRPGSWFTRDYPPSAAQVVARAAGSNGAVFANGAFSDWLLLEAPSLRGRLAYDARFEVLPEGRLADAAAVSIGRYDSEQILRPFDVLALRPEEMELRATLERAGNWRRVGADSKVVVLRRVTG
jgi:hypothetical protein